MSQQARIDALTAANAELQAQVEWMSKSLRQWSLWYYQYMSGAPTELPPNPHTLERGETDEPR